MKFIRKHGVVWLLVLVVVLLIYQQFGVFSLWTGNTRTPELLGDAPAIFLRTPDVTIGFMWNDEPIYTQEGEAIYAGFFVYADPERCVVAHAWGGAIGGAGEQIDCAIRWNKSARFQGWIDFRGHERAFCAAPGDETMPENCRLR